MSPPLLDEETVRRLQDAADEPDLSGTRYSLVRRIGRGGMATVYLVQDAVLGREAALKVLSDPDPSGALAARLLAEARLLARLEHPNLAPVHDAGSLPDGRPFYVMKYVRGERLDAWRRSSPTRAVMLRLFQKICDAVAFAHAHDVVHRDLKPDNVMIGAFGEALVMDWGVAKELRTRAAASGAPVDDTPTLALDGRERTLAGAVIGTPAWMAPEQARGEIERIDARTDVHGLGSLLYFLISGRPPYEAPGPDAVLRLAADGTPRPLRTMVPKLPKALAAICARAMAREPDDRYASARELAADIERYLDGQAVEAYRESLLERAGRFLIRNQALVWLVVAYLIVRILELFAAGR